jgi:hypothetical protein
MYLRVTQRRNRDGSVVRYVQLAHNRRVNGRAQAQVVANLGREDQIDVAAMRRLVASIGRYVEKVAPAGSAGATGGPAGGPPAWADGLIGRACELAGLSALLRRHPLVTVTGPAGVGKTRLVGEFVQRARARYRKGLWWVDLAPLPPGAPVDAVVAAVLRVRGAPGHSLRVRSAVHREYRRRAVRARSTRAPRVRPPGYAGRARMGRPRRGRPRRWRSTCQEWRGPA